jgi:primosomal protein N' (replication factor Y)
LRSSRHGPDLMAIQNRENRTILKVALPVPMDAEYDYLPPPEVPIERLLPGIRLEVPFGRQKKTGLLLGIAAYSELPSERLRPALRILDETPILSPKDLELLRWASRYYHHPLGDTVFTALSTALRAGKAASGRTVRRLTALPQEIPEARPLRAPRLQFLLGLLDQHPKGLSSDQIRQEQLGAAARSLVEKGLATWLEQIEEAIEVPPSGPKAPQLPLNSAQEKALSLLSASLGSFSVNLLYGVTGSGKTEIYLRLVEEVLARGQQSLVLLPEINLTPQLEGRFRHRLATDIRILHSSLTETERLHAWMAFQSGQCQVLLGTRSALFTPAPRLGLIILDEEHDASFKQQEGFRFSAREAAIMRGHLEGIPIVLGSATPAMETLFNVTRGKFRRIDLPERAGGAQPPSFQVVDIRAEFLEEGLSARLVAAIRETLARKEQVLLFVNRRGFAPVQTCHACGWVATCRHCDTRLVTHQSEAILRCHHCGFQQSIPCKCPGCGSDQLVLLGLGTERIEEALSRLFPTHRLVRVDRDTTRRKGQLETYLESVHSGETDILIGTQMLAKGHHFPDVTLVGILDVDGGLFSSDFRASERTAQLILQVAGRAGRAHRPGRVLLQTRHPGHPVIDALIHQGYEAFSTICLKERELLALPPFSHQALIRADASRQETVRDFLKGLAEALSPASFPEVMVLGPVPSPMERRGNRYRWQVLLQSSQRNGLHHALHRMRQHVREDAKRWNVRWSIDVDPIDLY